MNKDNIICTEVLALEMSNGLQKQKFLLDTILQQFVLEYVENRRYLSVLISIILLLTVQIPKWNAAPTKMYGNTNK